MTYVKKLVMHGFKSFPKKTELPFTKGINVILGPNGSGKSNISDALCFVLGRLSIKSIRAAKARNLIFLGTKEISPLKEAMVEIIFDNSDKEFSLDEEEISVKRIVRRNGQSIYKINNQTKTRQEVLSLLAQAGIDPNGFNIILQGEIQNFVRMHVEERRKVIEEVSGISVYEIRKTKSLRELEKIEEKLKEVLAILRERTAYLANLEKERQQALRFKKLEENVKKYKASIINYDLTKKKKEANIIETEISKKNKEIENLKKQKISLEAEIEALKTKINSINSKMQKSTGLEQEKLNQEIANVRAELAGMNVRLENYETRLDEISKEKSELEENIKNNELDLSSLQKGAPSASKNKKEVEIKKKELERLEQERKKFYTTRSELKSLKTIIEDKKTTLQNYINESEFLLKQIETLGSELFDPATNSKKVQNLKALLLEKKELIENFIKEEKELEKLLHENEYEINRHYKLRKNLSKMDVCPLCKTKITENHISHINNEILPKIEILKKQIDNSNKKLVNIGNKKRELRESMDDLGQEISKREADLIKQSNINEKKGDIKNLQEKLENLKHEILVLEKKKRNLEKSFDENSNIEQKCEILRIEIQEISMRSRETIDSELSFKEREIERMRVSLKQFLRDEEDLKEEIENIKESLEEKEMLLEEKKNQEEQLSKQFQKLISEREILQKKIRENEYDISTKSGSIYNAEQEANDFKIEKARISAEIENLEVEMLEFKNVEIIKSNKESLIHRLEKTKEMLLKIGSVNLRSLEIYDSIKKEYDSVREKVEIISQEKEGILKLIHEIDIKKKKTFIKTLNSLNELFSRNFSQLSTKGRVFLEMENKKNPFESGSGVQIIVKTGHGKYFDVKSLSGGEQTIVALSLIFAIQELNPYYFYLLDEIDAALDKRNSARLANLLQKYMKKGQYIVITHNDEIISNATNLYGINMHDGISKVISLKV